MTDDLVKRLRELTCNSYDAEVIEAAKDAMDEAADRIAKLEAALRRIKHMHEDRGVDDIEERDDRTYFIVCNALDAK